MIWTVEPVAPWRITAADADAGARAQTASSLYDAFAADDRPALEVALIRAGAGEAAVCPCHDRTTGGAGRLVLTPLTKPDQSRELVAAFTPLATSMNGQTPVVNEQHLRQLLGVLGHDLRTPLNGVLGMSRLLLDSGLRVDQVEYARAIDTSAEHLLSVIEDLLEFATLDVETVLHQVDFSPRALVEDVAESLSWRAAEKDTEICGIVSASVPELVEGDVARLRQILSYLVSDGISWADVGDVVLRVTRGEDDHDADDEAGVLLRFEVSATESPAATVTSLAGTLPGVGTARSSLTEASPRAAVCRHLVARMGGTVGATTEGTRRTAWFTTRVRPQPAPPEVAPSYVSLIGRRVLCVDDHPVSQRVLLERLRCWNLTVEATADAHSALTAMKVASAAGQPFELAILDLRLPGMDGLTLARMIRTDPVLAATKLVLLTGYPARGQAAAAQEAGIDAYLQKPVREAPLRSCIEMLLGGGRPPALPLLTSRRFDEERTALRPRVLVAEDNPVSQKVAVQMLEKLGCRVDVVSGGTEAVQAIARTPYHLVLMDCHLRGIDGLDATRQVRQLADHAVSPPIIAITGESGEQERDACLAAGMNDFLSKPLRLGTLREKLAQWIDAAPASPR